MKKFFAVAALILGIFVAQISQTEAFYDPYENDANFACAFTGHGGSMYLDLNSVDVQEYDPPHYQIAGRFVFQPSNNASVIESYIEMHFNYRTKESSMRTNGGQWEYLGRVSPDGTFARGVANALFRAAYRMNFYN
ncbi:MAG: hypothetical protein IKE46_03765 [Selenomonadaceae bacterium]|nr:hypothetical protein [Selenomonadaceae bacterium]MBR3051783.1 hypothetical protein [Selenomonadaceae bacterium]